MKFYALFTHIRTMVRRRLLFDREKVDRDGPYKIFFNCVYFPCDPFSLLLFIEEYQPYQGAELRIPAWDLHFFLRTGALTTELRLIASLPHNIPEAESKDKHGVWDPMPELTIQ
jgi:hypothetical protein